MRTVWLEWINCKGTESHIDDCQHSGWVKPKKKLNFYDLAGVMCHTEKGRALLPPVSSAWGGIDVSICKTNHNRSSKQRATNHKSFYHRSLFTAEPRYDLMA